MTSNDTKFLSAIIAEVRRVESLRQWRDWANDDPNEWVRRITDIENLRLGYGIRSSRIVPTVERQSRKRALARLEREGLVARTAPHGRRKTHVALTNEGQLWADCLRLVRAKRMGLDVSDCLAACTG